MAQRAFFFLSGNQNRRFIAISISLHPAPSRHAAASSATRATRALPGPWLYYAIAHSSPPLVRTAPTAPAPARGRARCAQGAGCSAGRQRVPRGALAALRTGTGRQSHSGCHSTLLARRGLPRHGSPPPPVSRGGGGGGSDGGAWGPWPCLACGCGAARASGPRAPAWRAATSPARAPRCEAGASLTCAAPRTSLTCAPTP